jgi:hypothetical protein
MMGKIFFISFMIGWTFFSSSFSAAEPVLSHGYVLCGAYAGQTTVLIGGDCQMVYTWNHPNLNGYSVYLLENGNLLRTAQVAKDVRVPPGAGPIQGIVEEVDPTGVVVWSYQLANDTFCMHHDIKPMPDGNFLACSFEARTIEEAKAVGVDTALFPKRSTGAKVLLSERIIEVNPRAAPEQKIVWQWLLWDHIVPKSQAAEHPELFNGSAGTPSGNQWVHLNGIDYCPRTDLIVFTSRLLNECFVIDHGTTTQEAAGHTGGKRGKGGDFLYRWGNPKNYDTAATQYVFVLHCPTWIPENCPGAGNILFFHNNMSMGSAAGGTGASEVVEIVPPIDGNGAFIKSPGVPFGPEAPTWKYAPGDSFSSMAMSSAFRLANGNTLAHEAYPPSETSEEGGAEAAAGALSSNSRIREVTPDQKIVWSCTIGIKSDAPDTGRFQMAWNPAKIMYYPSEYAGIKNLFAKIPNAARRRHENPHGSIERLHFNQLENRITVENAAGVEVTLYSLQGERVASVRAGTNRLCCLTRHLSPGMYFVMVKSADHALSIRPIAVMP